MRSAIGALIALTGLIDSGVANAQTQPLRIGVIDDLSGVYSGNGGPNTVLATTMAVEDFGGRVLDRQIEVISADHQNKPDIGSSLARQFVDQRGVTAIVNGGASSVGLAIQAYARDRKVTTLISGGYAANFSGEGCSPYGTQWLPRRANSPTLSPRRSSRAAARSGISSRPITSSVTT